MNTLNSNVSLCLMGKGRAQYVAPTFPTIGVGTFPHFTQVSSIHANNAIVGIYGGFGTYYSTNYGKNYTQSTGISGTIGTTVILGVSVYGLRAITHTQTLAFYSSNAGQSWTLVPNLPGVSGQRNYQGCSIYENYAIIADANGKIYVSANFGVTWATISGATSGSYRTPSISYDPVGAKYIAVCTTLNNGMWFCTNFTGLAGNTFTKSASLINSYGVSLVGLKGISGAGLSGGMYYTVNGGQTWTKATNASGTTSSTTNVGTYMVGLSENGVGIAAGTTNVYYVTKNFGITWSAPSGNAGAVVSMHNGNAIMYSGNNPAIPYYGKISL
jgi:photosystem II stability/assembly factor-like uncharacterized protein